MNAPCTETSGWYGSKGWRFNAMSQTKSFLFLYWACTESDLFINEIIWMYLCVNLLVCFRMNSHVVRFLERRKKSSSSLRNGAANNAELDDGCDATAVLLKKGGMCFVKQGFSSSVWRNGKERTFSNILHQLNFSWKKLDDTFSNLLLRLLITNLSFLLKCIFWAQSGTLTTSIQEQPHSLLTNLLFGFLHLTRS